AYVNLRGLTIQGVGAGRGLAVAAGFSVTVTNCVIRNHTGDGIFFQSSDSNSNLSVSSTLLADNGGNGILVIPNGTGSAKAVLNRVEAYNNSIAGISVDGGDGIGTLDVTVADSVAASNSFGIGVGSVFAQKTASLMVVRSTAANNGTGLSA